MRTLMAQAFTRQEVTALRHAIGRQAAESGLCGIRLEDFVLAVHESVTNAVEHAGGHGSLKMWTCDGLLQAQTVDQGTGIPDGYLNGHGQPSGMSFTGRGIYLIRRLCDGVDIRTGPLGTTVEITMRLPRTPRGSAPPMKRVRVAMDAVQWRHFTA